MSHAASSRGLAFHVERIYRYAVAMNPTPESATDPTPSFATFEPDALLGLLFAQEDRASRELIEACAAHGDAMVEVLRGVIDDEYTWASDESGDWWMLLHAAFTLGRIPSESAGLALASLMHLMDEHEDADLQDWLAGNWPALFANKSPTVIDAVKDIAEDPSLGWYVRCQAVEVVLDSGLRAGKDALEKGLDWVAALTLDESDEWLFRISSACTLLDFPRPRHRRQLESMAHEEHHRQAEIGPDVGMYTIDDVEGVFAQGTDKPDWHRVGDNPWKFYDPDAIAARQQRWQEEGESAELDDPDWDAPIPYVRATPKVGRNEPCPCGSGKKYKRCCLAMDERIARDSLENL